MKRCLLCPCPGCNRVCSADEGHHLCRQCEGYPAPLTEREFGPRVAADAWDRAVAPPTDDE